MNMKCKKLRNLLLDSFYSLKHRIRWNIGYVPFISKFYFKNQEKIFKRELKSGVLEEIKSMNSIDKVVFPVSYSRHIRNKYLLWHPNNPYTMKPLSKLPSERWTSSPYHPDVYSWAIVNRLILETIDLRRRGFTHPYDMAEKVTYSLIFSEDESEEVINEIKNNIKDLLSDDLYSPTLVNDMMYEIHELHPSPTKMKAIMEAIQGEEHKIDSNVLEKLKRKSLTFGIQI